MSRRSDFIESVDWISLVPKDCAYDYLIDLLKDENLSFSKRFIGKVNYVVIDKSCYEQFFESFERVLKYYCYFTRIDLKFDFNQPYKELCDDFHRFWNYSTGICDKENFQTIYFNSRNSDLFCRLYDKQKESNLETSLSRLEYEVKGIIARQFSLRYTTLGLDDALNYLYYCIDAFNFRRGIDSIIESFEFKQPIPINVIEESDKREKLRRFLKQYGYTILNYVEYVGGNSNFFDLCHDLSLFDELVPKPYILSSPEDI